MQCKIYIYDYFLGTSDLLVAMITCGNAQCVLTRMLQSRLSAEFVKREKERQPGVYEVFPRAFLIQ